MKRFLLLSIISLLFFQSRAFTLAIDTVTLRHYKVIRQTFNEQFQDYVSKDTIQSFGKIKIDSTEITFMDFSGNIEKTFSIKEKGKEEHTKRDFYKGTIQGEKYMVAITPDAKILTLLGYYDRFIYILMSKDAKFVILKPENTEKEISEEDIFIASTLQEPPLFGSAQTVDESDIVLNNYILEKLKEKEILEKGKAYFTVTLDKKGSVIGVKELQSKNPKLGKAVMEILMELPYWKPGKQNAQTVKCNVTVAVKVE